MKEKTHDVTWYLFTFVKSNTKWVLSFSASPKCYYIFLVSTFSYLLWWLSHTLFSASKTSSLFLTFTWWSFKLFHWENEAISKELPHTPTTKSISLLASVPRFSPCLPFLLKLLFPYLSKLPNSARPLSDSRSLMDYGSYYSPSTWPISKYILNKHIYIYKISLYIIYKILLLYIYN